MSDIAQAKRRIELRALREARQVAWEACKQARAEQSRLHHFLRQPALYKVPPETVAAADVEQQAAESYLAELDARIAEIGRGAAAS